MKRKISSLTSILLIITFTSQQMVWACPAPITPTQWDRALRPRAAGERGGRDGGTSASKPTQDSGDWMKELIAQAKGDSIEARQVRQELILKLYDWVKSIARTISQLSGWDELNIDTDELTQVGVLGLIEALERFDQERGTDFENYAYNRIIRAMLNYANKELEFVLITQGGETGTKPEELPSPEDVPDMVAQILGSSEVEIQDELERLVSGLEEASRKIIVSYFGLFGEHRMKLREIGEQLGITEFTAWYRIKKILSSLKNRIESRRGGVAALAIIDVLTLRSLNLMVLALGIGAVAILILYNLFSTRGMIARIKGCEKELYLHSTIPSARKAALERLTMFSRSKNEAVRALAIDAMVRALGYLERGYTVDVLRAIGEANIEPGRIEEMLHEIARARRRHQREGTPVEGILAKKYDDTIESQRAKVGRNIDSALSSSILRPMTAGERGKKKGRELQVGDEIAVPRKEALASIGLVSDFNTLNENNLAFNIKGDAVTSDTETMGAWREVYQRFSANEGVGQISIVFKLFIDAFLKLFGEGFKIAVAAGCKLDRIHIRIYAKPNSLWIFSNGMYPFFLASSIDLRNDKMKEGFSGSLDSILSISQPAGLIDLLWYSSVVSLSTMASSILESTSKRAKVSKIKTWGTPFLSTITPALESLSNLKTELGLILLNGISLADFNLAGRNFIQRKFTIYKDNLSRLFLLNGFVKGPRIGSVSQGATSQIEGSI